MEQKIQLGGDYVPGKGVNYIVWAPEHQQVQVHVEGVSKRVLDLEPIHDGYFQVLDSAGKEKDLYSFTIDGISGTPDLASRFQPQGVFGPSQVVNPKGFKWQETNWVRPGWKDHVIYEIHVGTFTAPGTYVAAAQKLDYLRDLGITAIELMPLAAWAGERNWGYDGVLLYAPHHAYGTPDELRSFVDLSHSHGMAVILDVVYNHLGSVGNFSHRYSRYFFHQEKNSPWGSCFDLEGPHSGPVRAFLLQNLRYWMDEFRIDGFRLDATHAIHDESSTHLMVEASSLVHEAGGFIIAEDERNMGSIIAPADQGGWAFDAVWADDFHHSIQTSQTHDDEIYRDSYKGSNSEMMTILTQGWLYTGQVFPFTGKNRGSAIQNVVPGKYIYCLSNHDQVGNHVGGEYLHHFISPSRYRAVSLFFLLLPQTPLLFMGQEWGTGSSFYYFTDLPGTEGQDIKKHRKAELGRLFWKASDAKLDAMPDPQSLSAFDNSKLQWHELELPGHKALFGLYREALQLRREIFSEGGKENWGVEATSDSVTVFYAMNRRTLRVTLYSNNPEFTASPNSRQLLSSNSASFHQSDENVEAETVVVEILK